MFSEEINLPREGHDGENQQECGAEEIADAAQNGPPGLVFRDAEIPGTEAPRRGWIISCCQLLPWISVRHLEQVMTMRPLPRGTRHTVRQLGQVKYLCSLSRLRDRACRRG